MSLANRYETDPLRPGKCSWCAADRDDIPRLLCKRCQQQFQPNDPKKRLGS